LICLDFNLLLTVLSLGTKTFSVSVYLYDFDYMSIIVYKKVETMVNNIYTYKMAIALFLSHYQCRELHLSSSS
jgi:hypothetical protein